MFKEKIKQLTSKTDEGNNKKKIENLVFLLIILIVVLVAINFIWNDKKENVKTTDNNKKLAIQEETKKDSFSNRMTTKKFMPTLVKGNKFDKIIFQDMNNQDVEYILHPRANQDILKYGVGTIIEVESAKVEENMNILCKYKIIQIINPDGTVTEFNDEELKKAV